MGMWHSEAFNVEIGNVGRETERQLAVRLLPEVS